MNASRQTLHFLNVRRYGVGKDHIADFTHKPRPFFSFGLIEEGEIDFVEGDCRITARPGDIVMTPLDACYLYHARAPRNQLLSVHFGFGRSAEPFAGKRYRVQLLPSPERLHAHMQYLADHSEDPACALSVMAHLFTMLDEAFGAELSYTLRPPVDVRLRPAMEALDGASGENLPAARLAALCGLSESHFYALFKSSFGMTPVEFKNRAAIRRAEQLLLSGSALSIEQVSELAGYSSASYFRRVCEAYTGMSPREYRKNLI